MADDLVRRLREPPFGTETSERNLMAAAADEIERLRAGGCARDQTTTQFCAEVVTLQAENARLREALENVLAWLDAVYVCAPELGGLLLAMYRARAALAEQGEK